MYSRVLYIGIDRKNYSRKFRTEVLQISPLPAQELLHRRRAVYWIVDCICFNYPALLQVSLFQLKSRTCILPTQDVFTR